jgi:mRNA-degrading endonuclease RelE of RelBE toxin-antitoxin system
MEDLQHCTKQAQGRVLDAIERDLTHQPLQPTRRRKQLRENPLSGWELRVDDHRIFYDVDEASQTVTVKSVGVKEHNVLRIRGEEYKL